MIIQFFILISPLKTICSSGVQTRVSARPNIFKKNLTNRMAKFINKKY